MNRQNDTYKTIAEPCVGTYKEKGSKFLAYAFPIKDAAEAKQHVQQLKKEHFDARHHSYAYRIGLHGEQWRANDDGEPSSTAGKPILGQLLSSDLTNVLVVVVRYFGGIQLGVPGLIHAYRSATADALSHAQIIIETETEYLTFTFPYEALNSIMKLLKEEECDVISQKFDTECILKIAVPKSKTAAWQQRLEKLSGVLVR
ncbi:MAG: YigZ family protein [Prevotellaceae bacterium]|nr:YigZ family protein [Prevotellaceae bacterium]